MRTIQSVVLIWDRVEIMQILFVAHNLSFVLSFTCFELKLHIVGVVSVI